MSYNKNQIKDLYVQLKASGQLKELGNSKELVLYLLKENNLLAEVLDFAEVLKENKDESDIA